MYAELYYEVYYNTPPPGKNIFIQLQIAQVAEDDVEGDHWTLEEKAGQATAEEEEVEVAEDGHVE